MNLYILDLFCGNSMVCSHFSRSTNLSVLAGNALKWIVISNQALPCSNCAHRCKCFMKYSYFAIVIRKQEILKVTLLDFSNYATSLPRTKYKSNRLKAEKNADSKTKAGKRTVKSKICFKPQQRLILFRFKTLFTYHYNCHGRRIQRAHQYRRTDWNQS